MNDFDKNIDLNNGDGSLNIILKEHYGRKKKEEWDQYLNTQRKIARIKWFVLLVALVLIGLFGWNHFGGDDVQMMANNYLQNTEVVIAGDIVHRGEETITNASLAEVEEALKQSNYPKVIEVFDDREISTLSEIEKYYLSLALIKSLSSNHQKIYFLLDGLVHLPPMK